ARRGAAPDVPAIDVVLIRSVENAALVCAQRHVFHIKIARREELRSSTGSGDGVEMVVSVFLAREDDATCIRELQRLKRKQRQRIFHRIAAMKELATFTALRVRNPKRLRSRELRNERAFEFDSGLANKHDLFAVRRPNWTSITIRGRREISDLLRRQVEHGDERVVLAVQAKRDPFSVWRPARRVGSAE